jgi:hypothetical protein
MGRSLRVFYNYLMLITKCTAPVFILFSILLLVGVEGALSVEAAESSPYSEGLSFTSFWKTEIEAMTEKGPLSVQLRDYDYLSRYLSPFSRGDDELLKDIILLAWNESRQLLLSEEYPPLSRWEKALVLAELNLRKRYALYRVSEVDLLDYYEQHPERYISADTFYLRHILVHEMTQAYNVILKLLLGGDFEELARIYSKDIATACLGGRLGWLTADELPSEFTDRIPDLEEGGFYGPLASKYGFHVVQMVYLKKAAPLPFRSVREQVEQDLVSFRVGRMLKDLRLNQFSPSAHVRCE